MRDHSKWLKAFALLHIASSVELDFEKRPEIIDYSISSFQATEKTVNSFQFSWYDFHWQ